MQNQHAWVGYFAVACAVAFAGTAVQPSHARARGLLTTIETADSEMEIVEHRIDVTINNGFVRTVVTQVYENPNDAPTDALYILPLPRAAALAEMTVVTSAETLYGEVIPRDIAEEIYEEVVNAGGQAAIASKESYQRFEFHIAAIPADSRATITFAYLQPLDIDAGIGRYVYPVEDGGTDSAPQAEPWSGPFSANVTLHSNSPVLDAKIDGVEESLWHAREETNTRWTATAEAPEGVAADFVFYYELETAHPGDIQVIAYRDDSREPENAAGTFLALVTPGADLRPITRGTDYVFVLDVSGSMEGKLETLLEAVSTTLESLGEKDRFRIVKFSDSASEVTSEWMEATDVELERARSMMSRVTIEGGTNIFEGLSHGLDLVDSERPSAVVLVTDGVTNVGLVDGPSFVTRLQEQDARVFGFLMGNSANWPLLELITQTSGGFYESVSNQDDMATQLLRVREKFTHEALHHVELEFDGGGVHDLTPVMRVAHRGEQMVVFGHYSSPGLATLRVSGMASGRPIEYSAEVELPEEALLHPELERLWALLRSQYREYQYRMELADYANVQQEIEDLGVQYQIVTDETSMILLSDEDFAKYGIDRNNRERIRTEQEARALRGETAVVGQPSSPESNGYSGSYSAGGASSGYGAMSWTDLVAICILLAAVYVMKRRQVTDVR